MEYMEHYDSLFNLQTLLNQTEKNAIAKVLIKTLSAWRNIDFVHGDLSPRNILVLKNQSLLKIAVIDWLIDLKNFSGTPKYCSPSVFQNGFHNSQSDEYALNKILFIL
jgi:serine/threonine protein kinase